MANLCRCCSRPMKVDVQPALLVGRPDFEIATCKNPDCVLLDVTLKLGEHERLSEAAIASYGRVNARLWTLRNTVSA